MCPKISSLTWEQMASCMDLWEWWLASWQVDESGTGTGSVSKPWGVAVWMSTVWPLLLYCRAASSLKTSRGPSCSPAVQLSRGKRVLGWQAFHRRAMKEITRYTASLWKLNKRDLWDALSKQLLLSVLIFIFPWPLGENLAVLGSELFIKKKY